MYRGATSYSQLRLFNPNIMIPPIAHFLTAVNQVLQKEKLQKLNKKEAKEKEVAKKQTKSGKITKQKHDMRLLSFLLVLCCGQFLNAQTDTTKTIAELQTVRVSKAERLATIATQIKTLAAEKKALDYEVLLLDDQIIPWPRWTNGFSGTLGLNAVNTNNWFLRGAPNITSTTINVASNGFVMLEDLKWYWKTDYRTNLGWLKFNDKDIPDDNNDFKTTNDIFQAKSIFGWKIKEKLFFASGLYYRTSLLDDKFNNPSYLTIAAVGLTWKPVPNLVVDIAPATYNYIISRDDDSYISSFGNNLQITYSYPIFKGLTWKTDLTAFTSYKDTKALSNWTWFNMLTTSVKGLGLVFDVGFRSNRQEALAFGSEEDAKQVWWMLGLNYAFSLSKK